MFDDRSIEEIIASMQWLNLDYDEGPFRQTQRHSIYKEKVEQLLGQTQKRMSMLEDRIEEQPEQILEAVSTGVEIEPNVQLPGFFMLSKIVSHVGH